jgi:isopenicillin-N epimerase
MSAFGHAIRDRFVLEPGVDFLNHGSFGAPPRTVLDEVERWRVRMEANPDHFFRDVLPGALRQAGSELARLVRCEAADLVFVENATAAVNVVLRSLQFKTGDEILLTSQTYGAVRQVVRYVCERTGARSVESRVPLPLRDRAQLIEAIAAGLGARTRLVIVDHISSPSGIVWPLAEIGSLARARGVAVLVDGAHAPGQLELDVPSLGADWYAGNCHKWLFAARGCAFLWARRDAQAALHPLAVSHAYGNGFTAEFEWTGTRDFSPWLAVGTGIRFLEELGAERARRYCHELAASAAQEIARAWQEPLSGAPALHGAMMAIRLPAAWQRPGAATREAASRIQSALLRAQRIAVAITPLDDALWARISAQVYNVAGDYERLLAIGLRGPG